MANDIISIGILTHRSTAGFGSMNYHPPSASSAQRCQFDDIDWSLQVSNLVETRANLSYTLYGVDFINTAEFPVVR
jgi:hypothetical protein